VSFWVVSSNRAYNSFCGKERASGSIMRYAGASPKGNRSSGTAKGDVTSSLRKACTRCLLTSDTLSSRLSFGPLLTPMGPEKGPLRISSVSAHASIPSMSLLLQKDDGRTCKRPRVIPLSLGIRGRENKSSEREFISKYVKRPR
jgi:hypothetical protein